MEILPQTHGQSMNEGHLGGWALGGDGGTYYPKMWQYIVNQFKIDSMLDIGCGRGYSTKFFKSLGLSVTGLDGSEQAKDFSLIPDDFVHHDYTKGQSPVKGPFDFGWSCEFVEHVAPEFVPNFLADFAKCRYLAMTFAHPGQGGHHHVNENTQEYWTGQLANVGLIYQPEDTEILRYYAGKDADERSRNPNAPYFIPHFIDRGLFFKNDRI